MTHTAAATAMWTTRSLLEWMTRHFEAKQIDAPRVVAEMLLSHVLGCDRMRLYMEVDRPAQPLELASLREFVARAARHEPAQYLVGHAWFFARQFAVNRTVLIPRPCTETLVEHVLQWCRAAPGRTRPRLADVGTGCGCIAVSLAAGLEHAGIVATDLDEAILALAARNAATHRVGQRIEFRQGEALAPLRAQGGRVQFDVICSNPPYISDDEWPDIAPNVKDYEPESALRGGADGLDVIRVLIEGAPQLLRPGGQLVVEIAHRRREAVIALVGASSGLENPVVLKDHEGLWRVLVASA